MKSVYGPLVDIVAPAWKCHPDDLKKGMELILSWGLHSRHPKNIFNQKSLFSQDDETRFEFLKRALTNAESDYVWCVRGGFGSIRLIPALLKMRKQKNKKLFIGLSDISTLHLFLNQIWDWPSIHGPMLDRLGSKPPPIKYQKELRDLVTGQTSEIAFENLKPLNTAANSHSKLKGKVSGGNLITLQSSIGTEIEWQTNNKILFLEEIGERAYRIDRVLEHFRQIGKWAKPKALVFGDFTGGAEPSGKDFVPRVLKEFADSQKFPVYKGIRSGHGVIQRPVPFNTESTLERGTLICSWPKIL